MQTGLRIDWAMMLLNLRKQGMTLRTVSKEAGIPFTTLSGWQNLGREPLHSTGESFLSFYCKTLSSNREQLPRR